jgi:phosphonate transport system substrate-binding protein
MLNRRLAAVTLGILAGLLIARPGLAQEWQKKFPTIAMGVVTSENEADRIVRYKPVVAYLEKRLGVKVEFRNASDYAGVVEALKAGKLQVAGLGPAAYAQAWIITGGKVEPLLIQTDQSGDRGYLSVAVVKADSPYQSLADLKGKKFAFADPNSASGYQAPTYFMKEAGFDPEKHFGSTAFSGSHENSIIALLNGTFDAAATWYNNDDRSNFQRMWDKGMIPKNSVRIVWRSPLLPSSPLTVSSELPEDMKRDIKAAYLEMKTADPAAWQSLADGKSAGYVETKHIDYDPMIRMVRANQQARRGS